MQKSEKAIRASRTFMTFTSSLLAKRTPHLFKNKDLVIQIDDSVIIHPFAMHLVQQYVKEGYEIAANDFQFMPRYLALMEYLSYIKIDLSQMSASAAENIMRVAHSMHKKVIATCVDSQQQRDVALGLSVPGTQRHYIASTWAIHVHKRSSMRSNSFPHLVTHPR